MCGVSIEQSIVLFIIGFILFVTVSYVLFEIFTHVRYTMNGRAVPGSFQALDEKFQRNRK